MTTGSAEPGRAQRERLAAVWFADIAGYTRLSAHDGPAALRMVEHFQSAAREVIAAHEGRLVKFIGDAALAEFASASAAVRAANALERRFAEGSSSAGSPGLLRIGVHVGEVTVASDDDLYGDGVNTAARLQGAAEPGQVLVSEDVCRQLRRYPEFHFECLGEKTLRGLAAPITTYTVVGAEQGASPGARHPRRDGRSAGLRRVWRQRRTRWTAAGLLFALVAVLAYFASQRFSPSSAEAGPTRLAVLPFENLGPAQDAYFADGITEEITDRLSSIARLGVIAQSSAMTYRNTDKTAPEIARELGVAYLIEGSVRWGRPGSQQDNVQVTARLIRASDGTQVWKQDYDVPLANIFAVQAQIAEGVAEKLDISLLDPERRQVEARLTDDPQAYDYYLQGKSFYERSWSRADVSAAIEMYRRAVEQDPNFALAYAGLARANAWFHQLRYDPSEARLAAAKVAADRAVALDPELPEAHVALGLYYYWGLHDYDKAIEELSRAQRLQANDAETLRQIGNIQRRQGLFDDAIESYQRVVDLDPRSHLGWFNLGETYLFTRQYAPVGDILRKVNSLAPFFVEAYMQRARLAINQSGDLDAAQRIVREAEARIPPQNWRPEMLALAVSLSADPDELLRRLRSTTTGEGVWAYYDARGGLAWVAGRQQEAGVYYDSARVQLEGIRARGPDQAWVHAVLGRAYAGLGRRDEAVREAERATELAPVSKDALEGPDWVIDLAMVNAMVGADSAALAQLESAVTIPSWISRKGVRVDPFWRRFRGDERFRRIVAAESGPGGP